MQKILFKNAAKTLFFAVSALLLLNTDGFCITDNFLKACLDFAQAHDKRLAIAKEQLSLSNLRVNRSGRSFFPGIYLQKRSSRGTTITDEYESEELGIRASQPIYDGGRLVSSYKYDKFFLESAKLNVTKTREDLFYRVKTTYYEMLNARAELQRIKNTFNEINKLYEKTKLEYQAKAISELDLFESKNFRDKVENMYRSSEMNAAFAEKKLLAVLDIKSLDHIVATMEDPLLVFPDNIAFTLDECRRFVLSNNIDSRIAKLYIDMSNLKKKIIRARVIPKIYAEGFYGQSGEAFVTEPLKLPTVWNVSGKLSWGLWGNTLEASQTQEKAIPREVMDVSTRLDSTSTDIRLSLFDDMGYFVESKEGDIGVLQSAVDYKDAINKALLELEKFYNDYQQSLWSVLSSKDDMELKQRKLGVLRKRNEVYEASTIEVMDGVYKYADSVIVYTRVLSANYIAVCELERLTLMPLR